MLPVLTASVCGESEPAKDVSYLVDNKIIVLAEHQSTVNPNMPLRCLEYVTRLYEHIQNPRDRYSRTLKKIPLLAFYVFYNGVEKLPAKQVLKLSDSFIRAEALIPAVSRQRSAS